MHRLTSIVEEKDLIAAKELNSLLQTDEQQKLPVDSEQNHAESSMMSHTKNCSEEKEKDSVELHPVPIS